MSETETRPEYERLSPWTQTIQRLTAERDAARAEVAALRSAVEAVRALTDQALEDSTQPADDPCQWRDEHDCHATARYFLAERINAALASVGSSGEAESGEATLPADHGCVYCRAQACLSCQALPGQWCEHDCGGPNHTNHAATPAPVSSGGQANGDDDKVRLAVAIDDLVSSRGVTVDDDTLDFLVEFVADQIAAARPVLSREALRARLDGHWPSATGCHCGWRLPETARTQGPWRDHLADVLTPGGEQE